ncbi:hypothetical protein N9741_03645 [Octadecabacter sp.]|nr:hypothetical protein [Octadecabacter sp.]
MKNSFSKSSIKWGVYLAGINFVIALLTPNPLIVEPYALLVASLVLGFVGGVLLYIFNFVANEGRRFVKYQLAKVEGVPWDNHNAVRKMRLQTGFGMAGAAIYLLLSVLILYFDPPSFGAILFAPIGFAVFGFISGVLLFCILVSVPTVLTLLASTALPRYQKAKKILATAYHKWKAHDYRS